MKSTCAESTSALSCRPRVSEEIYYDVAVFSSVEEYLALLHTYHRPVAGQPERKCALSISASTPGSPYLATQLFHCLVLAFLLFQQFE